jgi:hypothetical protein
MRILRAIYHLDFARNYSMINRPGDVARTIDSVPPPGFFDLHGEDRASRRILAKKFIREERRFRSVTAEPNAIVINMEVANGIAIEALSDEKDFVTLCSLASALMKDFDIRRFERAGLRLFIYGRSRAIASVASSSTKMHGER